VRSMHLDQVEIEDQKAEKVGRDIWGVRVHLEILVPRVFPATLGHQDHNLISSHSLIKFRRLKVAKKDLLQIPSHICRHKLDP